MEGKRDTGRAEVGPSDNGKVLTVKCHSGSSLWWVHPASMETQNSMCWLCSLEAKAPRFTCSEWVGGDFRKAVSLGLMQHFHSVILLCPGLFSVSLHMHPPTAQEKSRRAFSLAAASQLSDSLASPPFGKELLTCFSQPLSLLTSHLHFLSSSPGQEGTQ